LKKFLKNNLVTIIFVIVGLIGGFLYWYFVGCADGTCKIRSNMSLMTIYGGLIGGLFGNIFQGFKRKKGSSENKESV